MQEKEFVIKLHYCVLHGYVEIWLWQGIFIEFGISDKSYLVL